MSKEYILATDLGKNSRFSEEYIKNILSNDESITIRLVTVLEKLDTDKISELQMEYKVEDLMAEKEEKAHKQLHNKSKEFEAVGFDTKIDVLVGNPGEAIKRRADELNIDGIFIGRGEHSQLGELFYGSVSHYLIINANVPVIVTPAGGYEPV